MRISTRKHVKREEKGMFKRAVIVVGLLALIAPVGCNTTRPVFYSWPHNKRKLRKVMDDFHEVHKDFDRIVFDLPYYPVEMDY